jgi:eukaryotic-like serine/threonine-protein kinase
MADPGIARPRYQGLSAVKRWTHAPGRPRAEFSLAVGDRVGELTIIGHLARGRVTELYQVWSNEHWCALTGKFIAPEHAQNGVAPKSFRQEERTLNRLRHPNIVRFFGSSEVGGRACLLLEYLAGPSLFDVLEALPKRRLHVPDAIRATMHVGAAVHYLHRRGYLYRDLKPANILLRAGIPILVDFDVVRRIDPKRRPADRLGTAPYMAPEQILRQPLAPATDVYGLGALLYELLTGHWPTDDPAEEEDFEFWEDSEDTSEPPRPGTGGAGADALSTDELEARYPQLTRDPVSPRQYNPRISRELAEIVLRCLTRDPCARFQTISGLLAALAPLLKGRHRLWPEGAPIERRSDTVSR